MPPKRKTPIKNNQETPISTSTTTTMEDSSSSTSQVRRSKRQSDLRDRVGSDCKKAKYPEGEWISTPTSGRRGKLSTTKNITNLETASTTTSNSETPTPTTSSAVETPTSATTTTTKRGRGRQTGGSARKNRKGIDEVQQPTEESIPTPTTAAVEVADDVANTESIITTTTTTMILDSGTIPGHPVENAQEFLMESLAVVEKTVFDEPPTHSTTTTKDDEDEDEDADVPLARIVLKVTDILDCGKVEEESPPEVSIEPPPEESKSEIAEPPPEESKSEIADVVQEEPQPPEPNVALQEPPQPSVIDSSPIDEDTTPKLVIDTSSKSIVDPTKSTVQQQHVPDASLFCADSDEEDDDNYDDESSDDEQDLLPLKSPTKKTKLDESSSADSVSTKYPCTICRQSSTVDELIRCQNCPRYFHAECAEKDRGDNNDPARRRFCPKCARSGFGPTSSMLSNSIAKSASMRKMKAAMEKKKKSIGNIGKSTSLGGKSVGKFDSSLVDRKSSTTSSSLEKPPPPIPVVIKFRRNTDSSLFEVSDLAKSCPGCGKPSDPSIKKKRETGQEYSIYCNVECVTKMSRRARRVLSGQEEERILIMDTSIGNVLDKRQSPYLKSISSWLRKHQRCYPMLPDVRRSPTPPPIAVVDASSTSKEIDRASSASSSSEQHPSSDSPSSTAARRASIDVGGGPKLLKISIGGEPTTMAVDPARLNVRKGLRDVLLLRAKEADDVLNTNEEIKQLAVDLEQVIYKAHSKDDVGYKSQCRSLVSNLRNPSNKGLFRRLLNGELPIRRAATLSAREMSSTEYSYWAAANEQERAEEQERLKSALETSKLFGRRMTKAISSEADSTCDIFGLLHNDTTNEHKSHLFDLNCKICTGKQKEDDTSAASSTAPAQIRKDKRDSSASSSTRTSVSSLIVRPDLGEKLIKRDDGKLDIVFAPPTTRQSDPLLLETTRAPTISSMAKNSNAYENAGASTSPAIVSSRSSVTTASIDSARRSGSVSEPAARISSLVPTSSIDSPVPTRLSEDKHHHTNPNPSSAVSSTIASSTTAAAIARSYAPTSSVPSFWHGQLDMPSWFRFPTSFKSVSGPAHLLKRDLPARIDVVGRISSKVVYDYLTQVRKTGGKDLIVFRLPEPPSDDDRQQWDGLLANMVQKQKFCVIDNKSLPMIKDFYILPLPANEEPNDALLPFHDGPGLEMPRKDTILGLVVRHRERQHENAAASAQVKQRLPSLDEKSPVGTNSPVIKTPANDESTTTTTRDKKPTESESKPNESPEQNMDYMKIIQFPSAKSGDDTGAQEGADGPSTTSIAVDNPILAQPNLKKLLDEIGQVQNTNELNKILNSIGMVTTTTTAGSPTIKTTGSPTVKPTSSRAKEDPRLRGSAAAAAAAVAAAAVSTTSQEKPKESEASTDVSTENPITTAPATESEVDKSDKDNANEWVSMVQTMMQNCLPQQQDNVTTTTSDGGEKSTVGPSTTATTNTSTTTSAMSGGAKRQSRWQHMTPSTPKASIPPPGLAIVAPRPPPAPPAPPSRMMPPPPFMVPPFGPNRFSVPPPQLPPDFASRPPPPFMPGFGPPPIPMPVSAPPPGGHVMPPQPPQQQAPSLFLPPPPLPPAPISAAGGGPVAPAIISTTIPQAPPSISSAPPPNVHKSNKGNTGGGGNSSLSEGEIEDEEDERNLTSKRKEKLKKKLQQQPKPTATWNRWDRGGGGADSSTNNTWRPPAAGQGVYQPQSQQQQQQEIDQSAGMYAQLNPIASASSTNAGGQSTTSANASSVPSNQSMPNQQQQHQGGGAKQGFYGQQRRPSYGDRKPWK